MIKIVYELLQQTLARTSFGALVLAVLTVSCASHTNAGSAEHDVVLQVLGSGGPIADDGRASSSYLLWVDGRARVMIDAGGGAFLRFGEAKAKFDDLDVIGISHFHADHSADLPAILKSGYFSERTGDLVIAGPGAGGPFPGVHGFLESMLDADKGAYPYLSGYLRGVPALSLLSVVEAGEDGITRVFSDDTMPLTVEALHVPHGIVPAVAYRITVGEEKFVFASDQNGSDPAFTEFAMDADILVMHFAIPETASGPATALHARPSTIGDVASKSKAKTLLLSHFMGRSLRSLDEGVKAVEERYDGRLLLAEDLSRYVP